MNATLKFSYGIKSRVNTKLNQRKFDQKDDEFDVESIKSSLEMDRNSLEFN